MAGSRRAKDFENASLFLSLGFASLSAVSLSLLRAPWQLQAYIYIYICMYVCIVVHNPGGKWGLSHCFL